jgi:hypothetical protein
MNYVGIDHHRQYSHMTLMDQEGQVLRSSGGFRGLGNIYRFWWWRRSADLTRFTYVAHLHAYAGVIPSIHGSGDRTHYGKIIKAGNRWLRWAAVEAAWPAIRADFDLRCFYERLARGKGANKAKVAMARRLLTIIYFERRTELHCLTLLTGDNSAALTRVRQS